MAVLSFMLTVQVVLLHAVSQHLIGCNKHDTDDESHGEGADQAFPDTCLPILLLRVDCGTRRKGKKEEEGILFYQHASIYNFHNAKVMKILVLI